MSNPQYPDDPNAPQQPPQPGWPTDTGATPAVPPGYPPSTPQGYPTPGAYPPGAYPPGTYPPAPGQYPPPAMPYYGPPSVPLPPGQTYPPAPGVYPAPPSMPLQPGQGYAPPSMPLPGYGAPAPVSQYGMPAAPPAPMIAPTPAIRQGFLVAGIGGVVALIAFFVLPFIGASVSATSSGAQAVLTQACGSCSYSVNASQATSSSGILWLVPLTTILLGVLGFFPAVRNRAYGTQTPRNGAIAAIAASGLGLLVLVSEWTQVDNAKSEISGLGSFLNSSGVSVSVGVSLGFWVMLLGLLAGAVGGWMALRETQPAQAAMPGMMPPVPVGAPPSMPYQGPYTTPPSMPLPPMSGGPMGQTGGPAPTPPQSPEGGMPGSPSPY